MAADRVINTERASSKNDDVKIKGKLPKYREGGPILITP